MQIGTRIGAYQVIAKLGEGGMGEVYRARDPRLQRDVAIKVLPSDVAADADRLARFTREAQLLASLNHPHIAHVYGVEHDSTTRALVMELVEGPTLSDRIADGPIPLDEALSIARQIAEALDAAHERGIIHRDLKPANIKLTADGAVKVLDFGLAKALGTGEASGPDRSGGEPLNAPTITTPAMTQAGIILGTAAYMSPEQARGKPVDKRSDIWAFGVVVYEMLTGRRLFAGETVSDTIAEVLKGEVDWQALPAGAPGVRRVLERALQRDPRKRLRDIGDAIAELDASPGVELALGPRRPAGVSAAIVALIAVAFAASAAGAAWLLKPPPPQAPRPVVRFTLPVDESLRNVERQAVAVSPDGSTLAISAGTGILLRRLDDSGVTTLHDTDGAGDMAFSADSQSLAFSTAGRISRVQLGGGAPQAMWSSGLSGDSLIGLTWSADGTLAFAFENSIQVLRPGSVAATPLKSAGGLYVGMPHFLPDGQSLLYYKAQTATPDSHVVVWHPLSGGEPVELIKGSAPQFVPPDRLLFTRGSTLLSVRLDMAARRVTGDAEVVTDQMLAGGSDQVPHFAASRTGDLYYLDGGLRGTEASTLVRARPGAEPVGLLDDARDFVDVRFSPDRRKLALHLADQDNDIWVLDVARRVLNRVTFVGGEDETPAWSPDGTELAFASTRVGDTERTIRIASADGSGNERVVWKYAGHAHVSDWSPDGRWLLVDLVTPGSGIQLVDLKDPQTTAKPFQQTSFSQSNARVSPNGAWVTYMSNESGRNEIYLQSFPQAGHKIRVSTGGGITAVWSRDGSRLFYRSQTHLMAVTVSYQPELAISIPQPVIADDFGRPLGETHTSFDVSAEGDFIFARSAAGAIKPRMHAVLNWARGLR